MTWKLSRFRAGDLVEVRSEEEILATLDQYGCLDQMPFMPEMLQYCGRRFGVRAVAHKTCDWLVHRGTSRRLQATVHLANLRCDGSAHGGCEAECTLFWKDEWLKGVSDNERASDRQVASTNAPGQGCTKGQLLASTRRASVSEGDETLYSCQATQAYVASQPLAWWDMRQYLFDVITGNHTVGYVLWGAYLAVLRGLLARIPFGYRPFKVFHDWMHHWLAGRGAPSLHGQIPDGMPTPTGRLDLMPGEYVRTKTQAEIEKTINKKWKNRGLSFDPEGMASNCGQVVKVHKRVTKIIDEPTGRMLYMKEPCITLEGFFCRGEFTSCRLNCPRAIPEYWREIWLERVEKNGSLEKPVD
jgi:hypothetical protein